MPERCRSCNELLPDDPDWTFRICPKCQDDPKRRLANIPRGSRMLRPHKPGECAECGVPLLSDEREGGICGACRKRSRFGMIHSRKGEVDDHLPPTQVGVVKHWTDILDDTPEEPPKVEDWRLGYATFFKDIEGESFLTVLQFHMNGGKAVVLWREQAQVLCLRFKDEVTRRFKAFEGIMDDFLLLPNGLCVRGNVNAIRDAMPATEVNRMIERDRRRLESPDSWGEGKFRRKIPMLVCALERTAQLEGGQRQLVDSREETPTRGALPGRLGSNGPANRT